MLLYLLKVLKQRGHENWVGPIRIWAGVGIQYCPLLIDLLVIDVYSSQVLALATVTFPISLSDESETSMFEEAEAANKSAAEL